MAEQRYYYLNIIDVYSLNNQLSIKMLLRRYILNIQLLISNYMLFSFKY